MCFVEHIIDSNVLSRDDEFTIDTLKKLLNNKFEEIDYSDAKDDVIMFIDREDSLGNRDPDIQDIRLEITERYVKAITEFERILEDERGDKNG